jgi:hypothetical protein
MEDVSQRLMRLRCRKGLMENGKIRCGSLCILGGTLCNYFLSNKEFKN